MYYNFIDTVFGCMKFTASDDGLTSISLIDDALTDSRSNTYVEDGMDQILQYLKGERKTFDVKLDISQGTPFYQKVWTEVSKVPFGQTKSYMDIAKRLDNVGAIRAVGMANGKNPLPIIIPCHRIIGSNGALTGYAYGLKMKKKLLMLENPQTFGLQQELF